MEGTYLAHHGILGQKWGKRNGPPYPLGYEDHSSAEKKQNSRGLIDGKAGTSSKKKSKVVKATIKKASSSKKVTNAAKSAKTKVSSNKKVSKSTSSNSNLENYKAKTSKGRKYIALSKIYKLNYNTYKKSNPTLASMNKTTMNRYIRLAQKADMEELKKKKK